ncbi:peptidase family m28 domain-containing protein [Hirsutella rhossiliensis]|uniref:Peptide hydrolase n=1 Tax=Hirsutella rhossiliensis TaxID=111463 RepID=A0A9P8N4W9_9HYPO|nr:peptidase family m28 domain-containing protein [Hirsutella rhossiliensis]KAH0964707.1 peptidase family m28 domain-containing protein [Hirsutella rhossiliensis]
MKLCNPFAFRPGPVTFWTTVVYLAVVIPLVYVHETVPGAPADDALYGGLNLTEAWLDLQTITRTYHPYNSHENDRDKTHGAGSDTKAPRVTVFDDRMANVTYTSKGPQNWTAQYFEGSNFYLYIRGKDDPRGVLVNCHFDSVSTGYGATDDGVACVSMLQLLSYFTSHGRQPNNGIVLLFNNAEEDGLLGARAFGYSPLLSFCRTFVNLEGAGAGGRAMLFRTTDLEAAKAYAASPHPFGSVVAANAFERGVIKSATDYSVFADVYGQRGLDIAFYEPRSRYHTQEDDARHSSVNSVWHMLSAALASTEALSKTTGVDFEGPRSDGRKDLVQNGRPTEGVWFDWFGNAWVAFPLRGLFAWSLTLLVATPLVLLLVTYLLARNDKYYFFARNVKPDSSDVDGELVSLGGWKGLFRYPFALLFAAGLTVASVFLVAKINPLIIYSSDYAVWAMTMSLFYFAFWLIARGSSFVRPSALQRGFAMIWLYIITWIVQVFAAVAEDRMHVGALYFAAFLHTAVFVSLMISLLEQFALPTKHDFAHQLHDTDRERNYSVQRDDHHSAAEESDGNAQGIVEEDDDAEDPTETTPLRGAPKLQSQAPDEREQAWSARLPTWTWLIQLLLLAPVHVIILGNLGLVQTTAMAMTGVDGNSLLTPLMAIGIVGVLLLLPLTPFMHRISYHVPVFLLAVFVGTLIYNLVAFPFSVSNRFKFRFQQTVDLDKGTNVVELSGLEEFVRPVIAYLPSAAGQEIECLKSVGRIVECQYDASSLPPDPADGEKLDRLVSIEIARSSDGRSASVQVRALNTRMCHLDISSPIFDFSVEGGGHRDDRFGALPSEGFQHIQLWRRTWEGAWNVTLQLSGDGHSAASNETGSSGAVGDLDDVRGDELKLRSTPPASKLEVAVRCAWDDANGAVKIPAFYELIRFMPEWAIVTKKATGLVQVRRGSQVPS